MTRERNGFTPSVGRRCSFEYADEWRTGAIIGRGPFRWVVHVGGMDWAAMRPGRLYPPGPRPATEPSPAQVRAGCERYLRDRMPGVYEVIVKGGTP